VLDSSAVISAERKKQPIPKFIEAILRTHGPLDLSLSPVTVAELPWFEPMPGRHSKRAIWLILRL